LIRLRSMKIGVLGAGQLGRMLALAGYPLGPEFRFFDTVPDSPAGQLAELVVGHYHDEETLKRFAKGLDAITYEFENVPVEAVKVLEQFAPVYPPTRALEFSQDRFTEKTLFRKLDIPVANFYTVNTLEALQTSLSKTTFPAVLKTRRMGYDGKGQIVLRSETDVSPAWQALQGSELILESFVAFEREVSIIAVRSKTGETKFYPLVENHHSLGILRKSIAPAPNLTNALQNQAEDYARWVLEELDYIGVLAIEFFVINARLIANEMAPRVHNSGHWTIEGAETSQFENHIRAVAGLPLGSTRALGFSTMLNLIGVQPNFQDVLQLENTHLHWYGKSVRSGRKVGHITVTGESAEGVQSQVGRLETLLGKP
jgi:5-(carboxyamino)imidazole ribonucleotide synthase